jgi:hypothetical protein
VAWISPFADNVGRSNSISLRVEYWRLLTADSELVRLFRR